MKEALDQGHVEHFYETVEQRFLRDERFVDEGGEEEKGKEAGNDQD